MKRNFFVKSRRGRHRWPFSLRAVARVRAAHFLVSPQSNSVHQPVREPTEPTDASACGAYESSDRRQRFPSAFRRTVASGSCSIRASISLSKARGIVSENSTRWSAFVPDIRTRRGSISSRQMTSVEAFISSSRSGCGVPFWPWNAQTSLKNRWLPAHAMLQLGRGPA